MLDLRVPDIQEGGDKSGAVEARPAGELQPVGFGEQQAQIVLAVDLMDRASREKARRTVDAIGMGGVSIAKSRILDRQLLSLAQADAGSSRITKELQRLATKARELDLSTGRPRRGLLGRLFDAPTKGPEQVRATLEDLEGIVASLSGAAEVLRQNNIALNGFETDIARESRKLASAIERAEDFHSALVAGIDRARREGASPDTLRFATHEVLYPLEGERQNLQSLLAVNQQATISLTILRETNAMLIEHVRYITVATRHILDVAALLRQSSSARRAVGERGRTGSGADGATYEVPGGSSLDMTALHESLDELFKALDAHDVWRGKAAAKKEEALTELMNLSGEVLEPRSHGVTS